MIMELSHSMNKFFEKISLCVFIINTDYRSYRKQLDPKSVIEVVIVVRGWKLVAVSV